MNPSKFLGLAGLIEQGIIQAPNYLYKGGALLFGEELMAKYGAEKILKTAAASGVVASMGTALVHKANQSIDTTCHNALDWTKDKLTRKPAAPATESQPAIETISKKPTVAKKPSISTKTRITRPTSTLAV